MMVLIKEKDVIVSVSFIDSPIHIYGIYFGINVEFNHILFIL